MKLWTRRKSVTCDKLRLQPTNSADSSVGTLPGTRARPYPYLRPAIDEVVDRMAADALCEVFARMPGATIARRFVMTTEGTILGHYAGRMTVVAKVPPSQASEERLRELLGHNGYAVL
jgi:hypothetical protein